MLKDGLVAKTVLDNHRYRSQGIDGEVYNEYEDEELKDVVARIDGNHTAEIDLNGGREDKIVWNSNKDTVTTGFLKKWIILASKMKQPTLTDAANRILINAWTEMRSDDYLKDNSARVIPVTARLLEGMIR